MYAGGDVSSMARFVTEAIGMGKRAAREIDRMLRGTRKARKAAAPMPARMVAAEPVVPFATINTFYYPAQARAAERRLPVAQRLASDAEVQLGFDLERRARRNRRAASPAARASSATTASVYCPDLAVKREGDGYVVLTDYCKGCGICVKECPTGSMKMIGGDLR